MASFSQAQATVQTPATIALLSRSFSPAFAAARDFEPIVASDQASSAGDLTTNTNNKPTGSPQTFQGEFVEQSTGGFDWFEDWHVVPRSFDFGNLLSDQSTPIEVFNAFRRDAKEWTSLTNNAGSGVMLGSAPGLPVTVPPLTGLEMTLEVSVAGDPFVDGSLDFAFSGVGTIVVPITIERIVLWGARPEAEFVEAFEFLTDVMTAIDGQEQRFKIRKEPRQSWRYDYVIDEGEEAQVLENLLFDFQARVFGVPVWRQETQLTAGAAAASSSITVGSTAYRDFRVGGYVVIFTSQATFDVLEISSVTSTTIGLASPTVNAYTAGTFVFPLSLAHMNPKAASGGRFGVNARTLQLLFRATNNDVELADLSAFSSYKSKLFLDNGNSRLQAQVRESYRTEYAELDGGAGLVFRDPQWDRGKRLHTFTLRAEGLQGQWEMRQMLYAIGGRWKSFYVPRDSDDLAAAGNLSSGSATMDVANYGYAQFVRNRQPKSDIRVNFVDGSTPLLRGIIGSTNIDASTDRLTLDDTWPSTITPEEISRIEYVEKVRFASDRLQIRHRLGGPLSHLIAPVEAVFE